MIDKPIEGLSVVVESSQVEERTLRGFAITQIYMEENYALVIEQDPPGPGCSYGISVQRAKPVKTARFVMTLSPESAIASLSADLQTSREERARAIEARETALKKLVGEGVARENLAVSLEREKSLHQGAIDRAAVLENKLHRYEADLAKVRKAVGEIAYGKIFER